MKINAQGLVLGDAIAVDHGIIKECFKIQKKSRKDLKPQIPKKENVMDAETRQHAINVVRAEEIIINLVEFLKEDPDRIHLLDAKMVEGLCNLLEKKVS